MPNIVDPTIPNYPPQGIQAQLDLLYLYNPDVAQKLIDQLNAGIIKMEELEKELEKALQDLQGVLRYKGSVETEADLPTEGNVIGDVWNITSTDENVAWNGTSWDKFGSGIDVSVFLTKTDAANTYATKQEVASVLPEQTGNAGKFLTTNGTDVAWEAIDAGVTSVNTKTGDVVLTGADINATLTGTGDPVTTTVTEHLQTLKNDETELGNQVSNIQALIPSDASETNLLATKADIGGGGLSSVSHDATLAGAGTDADPLKVADNTYLPLSGGTMTGALKLTAGTSGIQDQYGNAFLTVGDYGVFTIGRSSQHVWSNSTILPNGRKTLGNSDFKWVYVYTTKLNNGADLAVPTTGGTLARLEDIPAPELPTQEGNAGKFLTTNGTEVSWAEVQGGVSEIFHDDSLSGKGTGNDPLSVARPAAIIREW